MFRFLFIFFYFLQSLRLLIIIIKHDKSYNFNEKLIKTQCHAVVREFFFRLLLPFLQQNDLKNGKIFAKNTN
jgi:hypothetical protein